MKLSARNQLKGKIVSIDRGAVLAQVVVDILHHVVNYDDARSGCQRHRRRHLLPESAFARGLLVQLSSRRRAW